ncbi:hypothetical protein [Sphingomonas sp. PP-CE-1G-424]|uniref:hypothetical protein n=1 Tax=Sphingomonas sp. PP-CE-1G-424 TaxID=2135658 RepID=UPI001055B29C|nr:hypothetical protein [Sphingomonas sp. PP-CE-1G-424]TCP65405.1 hypothetical protein C8J43_11261 [Sphingomonas sp. PP-CE-1G-424]
MAAALSGCAIALGIILYGYTYSFERLGVGVWAASGSLLVLVVISIGSLAKSRVIPWNSRNPREWLRWQVLGAAVFELLLAALSATAVVQLLDPKDQPPELAAAAANSARAAEASGTVLAELVKSGLMANPGDTFSAGAKGVWGERGCAVTYEVAIENDTMVMHSVHDLPGMSSFRQVLRLAPARTGPGGTVTALAEVFDGPDTGTSILLSYERRGGVERLVRDQKSPQRVIYFDRCPA